MVSPKVGWRRNDQLLACAVLTAGFCGLFWPVLFAGENFCYRDAAHFYYPRYEHIQDQWSAGELPLWTTRENGGMPLLANPTSAVVYPGKLLFFVLSYPLAFKAYILAHFLLGAAGCVWLAKRLGAEVWGGFASGFSFAAGGFFLFQAYNPVFLCGAAWLPFGILAMLQLQVRPTLASAIQYAAVLSLQVLAGDPQTAYGLALIGIAYTVLACDARWRIALLGLLVLLGFLLKLSVSDAKFIGLALMVGATVAFLWWRERQAFAGFLWVVLAGGLVLGMTAVQVLPTLEFLRVADRSQVVDSANYMQFSFFPLEMTEGLLPGVWGDRLHHNSDWAPWWNARGEKWSESVFQGVLPLLAIAACCRRKKVHPAVPLFAGIALVSLVVSFGKFTDPRWLGWIPNLGEVSVYELCRTVFPGFDAWRYPSKAWLFVSIAVACLGAICWRPLFEQLLDRQQRSLRRLMQGGAAVLIASAVGVYLFAGPLPVGVAEDSVRGPFDPVQAKLQCSLALLHTGLVMITLIVLTKLVRSPGQFSMVGFVLLVLSVSVANRDLVITEKQSNLDAESTVAQRIAGDRGARPDAETAGFPRVFRSFGYVPDGWSGSARTEGIQELERWRRATLADKYVLQSDFSTVTGPGHDRHL